MQVNVVSVNSTPEVSVKQSSMDNNNYNSFKSAIDSVKESSKSTGSSDNSVQNTEEAGTGQKVNGKDEKKDKSGDLSILVSELLSGKIDISKITPALKDNIVNEIKSKLGTTSIDDNKLSDAVNSLINNLTNEQQKLNNSNITQGPDNTINALFSDFNNKISELLNELNPSSSGAINGNDTKDLLNKVDNSILTALKSQLPDASANPNMNTDTNMSTASSINTNTNNGASENSNYNNILYALSTGISGQDNVRAKVQPVQTNTKVGVKAGNTKNTDKSTELNLGQDLKNAANDSSKQSKLLNYDEKKQDLNSDSKSGGDDFLKNLTSNDDNSKFSKVTNFMTQFNNTKPGTAVVKTEGVTVSQADFSNDVIKTVKYMESNNIKDLTVKITPKELGEVTIKLTEENGVMKANITASNKDAYNLLNSNIKDISDKLQDANIKIQNFNIDVYNGDTTFFKDSSNRGSRQEYKSSKGSSIGEIAEEESNMDNSSVLDDNALNILA